MSDGDVGARPFIEWRGVRKSFGVKRVLRGLDLAIGEGSSVAILGASGSGKSVALRHVIGLVEPDAGQVRVTGETIADLDEDGLLSVRRRIAMVFQGGALFDSLTVGENVAFALHEHRSDMSPSDMRDRVAEVLDLVDLPGVEDLSPSSLSGGMRKRVALARALALGPAGILYDEPTTGLDPVTTTVVDRLIRGLQERLGVTSVVVTHDVRSAFEVADRIVFLRDGRLEFDGTTEEARARPTRALADFVAGRPSPSTDNRETI